jgi:hypothetical protein
MKRLIFLALAGMTIVACNDESTTKDKTVQEKTEHASTPAPACYLGVSGKDSIQLIVIKDDEGLVNGELNYLFYEKDKSRGTYSGRMKGDTLFADYTYTSEGMESKREIAFLQQGNTFTEGYGDAMEIQGVMTFKNPYTLQFGKGFVLNQVECKK